MKGGVGWSWGDCGKVRGPGEDSRYLWLLGLSGFPEQDIIQEKDQDMEIQFMFAFGVFSVVLSMPLLELLHCKVHDKSVAHPGHPLLALVLP